MKVKLIKYQITNKMNYLSSIKISLFVILSSALTSCVSWNQIGNLNMVSTRNIETTQKYELLQRYVEHSKKEMKKTRATTLQEAIDKTVKKVEGGEYLMNAKIYTIVHNNGFNLTYYYAVEGDVWGNKIK